jgi:hypothetical protein
MDFIQRKGQVVLVRHHSGNGKQAYQPLEYNAMKG